MNKCLRFTVLTRMCGQETVAAPARALVTLEQTNPVAHVEGESRGSATTSSVHRTSRPWSCWCVEKGGRGTACLDSAMTCV